MPKKQKYCYDYPRPMVTVDVAIFAKIVGRSHILLIERGGEPFKGWWALPGGFVDIDEQLEAAAVRELAEETQLDAVCLEQIGAFGGLGRDPRGRTISIVYGALSSTPDKIKAASDARRAKWFDIQQLPERLAFDHEQIIAAAKKWYAEKVG